MGMHDIAENTRLDSLLAIIIIFSPRSHLYTQEHTHTMFIRIQDKCCTACVIHHRLGKQLNWQSHVVHIISRILKIIFLKSSDLCLTLPLYHSMLVIARFQLDPALDLGYLQLQLDHHA